MKIIIALAAAGAALAATTASAGDRPKPSYAAIYDDGNPHYLDYKTDISEARRELRNDLDGADNAADRANAWAEYRREIADARHDFAKEMAERGIMIRRGTVTVEDWAGER